MALAKDWNWPKDPSVKIDLTRPGAPPDGHVRRCQARNEFLTKQEGKNIQCGRWARRERNYCGRHGGSHGRYKMTYGRRLWYSKHAGASLRERLAEMRNAPPEDRISLDAEIDLARVLAEESVKIFDKVCIEGDTGTMKGHERALMQAKATGACREALAFVASVVDKAAKVRASSDYTVDVEHIDYIIHQVQMIIERFVIPLKNGKDLCDKIAVAMKDIKLPDTQHSPQSAEERAAAVRVALGTMDKSIFVDPALFKNGRA